MIEYCLYHNALDKYYSRFGLPNHFRVRRVFESIEDANAVLGTLNNPSEWSIKEYNCTTPISVNCSYYVTDGERTLKTFNSVGEALKWRNSLSIKVEEGTNVSS